MVKNLGATIREYRKRKGITLNSFAETLDVSPGYLSNLETNKTDTIQLSLLSQIQKELNIFENDSYISDLAMYPNRRVSEIFHKFIQIQDSNPQAFDFWLNTLEEALNIYHTDKE
ncbi:helix-turn-helix domain-containing protein [Bacillus mobilis]|uniref:helix-turn-helix domain-containing protein n=1 Tax=Bacillus mobilis TaxID=2026190 RepID=UPI0021CE193A|nr:helix-turn-helix transcriptional regulator [Bacillus mobilis]MCU5198020.1 helix-turn-helix domain-containing protein [Bacillus mobilis]